uniref:Rel homology dimerisation domain-containing protein n=1 Tax=Stomoxys calcitrans TaxID=35570 RepID=A0A1I8PNY5_STOCA
MANTLSIAIQPKQNFHFRYLKELENTHGVLIGQQPQSTALQVGKTKSSIECGCSPTIKLQLPANAHLDDYQNKRDFYVLCSLHSYANNEPYSLSPHLLMPKGETEESYGFIFAKMDENPLDPCERTWQLQDYVIVRLKTGNKFENYEKSLLQKKNHYENLQLPMGFDKLMGKVNMGNKESLKSSGGLNVCLGFTIFEKDFYQNSYSLYKETIYSHNIFHGDDLNIHHLCNTKGSVGGGLVVTLLMKLYAGYDYNIHMVYLDPINGAISWEHTLPVNPKKIFSNAAITFELPKGPHVPEVEEFKVHLEVVVGQSTYKSQAVEFWYQNSSENALWRKRPRLVVDNNETIATLDMEDAQSLAMAAINPREMHDLNYNPNICAQLGFDCLISDSAVYVSRDCMNGADKNPKPLKRVPKTDTKNILHIILQELEDYFTKFKRTKEIPLIKECDKFGNTIFHAAIMDEKSLLVFYRHMKDSTPPKEILKVRNRFRHNLLHYACIRNKANAIKPLVGIGCDLQQQDWQGRTPLHLAIENAHKECISKFEHLLEIYHQYPEEVQEKFIKMFNVYDHLGHTIVHSAVKAGLTTLFEAMLKFCQAHNMDITRHEILGSGDSVIHLIAKGNLIDMLPLVKEYIPNYLTIQNYAGETAPDLEDLCQNMSELLKIN